MSSVRKLTVQQKKWVKARDGNKCVRCGNSRDLHVHHIVSHRLLIIFSGNKYIETPLNLVTVCKKCHISGRRDPMDCVHPDISYAMRKYRDDNTVFSRVFARRDLKIAGDVDAPLWNHKWDEIFLQHAIYASMAYQRRVPWPRK